MKKSKLFISIILLFSVLIIGSCDEGDTSGSPTDKGMQENLLKVLGVNQLLRVRFIENNKDEYIFEVIDTVNSILLKDSTEFESGTVFSVSSPEYKYYEEDKGYVYETGKEYIVCVVWLGPGRENFVLSHDLYIPLDDITKMSDKEYFNSNGIQDGMTKNEVVDKFKELLYPYNFSLGEGEEFPYTEIEALALFDVVHVKLIGKKYNNEDKIKDEFSFEIIEWLNDKENQHNYTAGMEFSVYSAVHPGKAGITRCDLLWYNYNIADYRDKGDEFVIVISKQDGRWYVHDHYFPLSDITQMHYKDLFSEAGITSEMSPDEIVTRLKELIAEEKANQ